MSGARRRALVLLGPPGAGKGTQAARMRTLLGADVVASGDLLRDASTREDTRAETIRGHAEAGTLVPEDIVLGLVGDAVASSAADWVVVDGYPKTARQAALLDDVCRAAAREVVRAVHLHAPLEVLLERLTVRGATSGRADDDAEVVARRLERLGVVPSDLLDHYADRGILVDVDGRLGVDDVTRAVTAGLPGPHA